MKITLCTFLIGSLGPMFIRKSVVVTITHLNNLLSNNGHEIVRQAEIAGPKI